MNLFLFFSPEKFQGGEWMEYWNEGNMLLQGLRGEFFCVPT